MASALDSAKRERKLILEGLRSVAAETRQFAAEAQAVSAHSQETIRHSLANIERLDRLIMWADTHPMGY